MDVELEVAMDIARQVSEAIWELPAEVQDRIQPVVTWTPVTLSFSIGDLNLWDDQSRPFKLTFGNIIRAFQEEVQTYDLVAKTLAYHI